MCAEESIVSSSYFVTRLGKPAFVWHIGIWNSSCDLVIPAGMYSVILPSSSILNYLQYSHYVNLQFIFY